MLNHKWLGEQHPKTFFRWPKYKLSALHSNEVWMKKKKLLGVLTDFGVKSPTRVKYIKLSGFIVWFVSRVILLEFTNTKKRFLICF